MFRCCQASWERQLPFLPSLLFLLHPAALVYSTLLDTTLLSGVLVRGCITPVEAETRIFLHLSVTTSSVVVVLLQVSLSTPFLFSYGCFSIFAEGAVGARRYSFCDNWRDLWVYVAKQYGQLVSSAHPPFSDQLVRSVGVLTYSWPYEVDPASENCQDLRMCLRGRAKWTAASLHQPLLPGVR